MAMQNIDDIIDDYTGLSRTVLEYGLITKRLVDAAKQPGFTVDSWAPLGELIDTDDVRADRKLQRGDELAAVRRLPDQLGDLLGVGLLVQAGHREPGTWCSSNSKSAAGSETFESSVNSVSVYEFNADGKITHVDVYLQMAAARSRHARQLRGRRDLRVKSTLDRHRLLIDFFTDNELLHDPYAIWPRCARVPAA